MWLLEFFNRNRLKCAFNSIINEPYYERKKRNDEKEEQNG